MLNKKIILQYVTSFELCNLQERFIINLFVFIVINNKNFCSDINFSLNISNTFLK